MDFPSSSQAASACQSGLVLVDGHVSPGRRMLQGGEVVLLRSSATEEGGDAPTKRRGGEYHGSMGYIYILYIYILFIYIYTYMIYIYIMSTWD